jgi:hypothetical protein
MNNAMAVLLFIVIPSATVLFLTAMSILERKVGNENYLQR